MNSKQQDKMDVNALFQKGMAHLQNGRIAEAKDIAKRVLNRFPDHADMNYLLGLIAGQLGQYDQAEKLISQSIKSNPSHPIYYQNLGVVLTHNRHYVEALQAYERAIQFKPDYAMAHNNKGIVLCKLGRSEEALAAYKKAIQLKQDFDEAYENLGLVLLQLGRLDEAKEALKTALHLNSKLVSATYLLAGLGEGKPPAQSPVEYVTKLFDGCASSFDKQLINTLGYRAPEKIFNAVQEQLETDSKKLDILDLGCGTGLCGVSFSCLAGTLVGVDLSAGMIDKAKERGIYTEFIQADICHALERCSRKFDLVLSADVFIYTGKLDRIFTLINQCLVPGGLFSFSIETNETGQDYQLRFTGRYAHSTDYIDRIATDSGFEKLITTPITIRYERGLPVYGNIIVLCKSSQSVEKK